MHHHHQLIALALLCLLPSLAAAAPPRVRAFDAADLAGCTTARAAQAPLASGLDGGCVFRGLIGQDETVAFTFTIANESSSAPQQQQQPFNLLLQLRSVNGAARLGLITPQAAARGTALTPPSPAPAPQALEAQVEFAGARLYATAASAEEFLALPGAYLARWPGRYTAVITRSGGGDDGDGGRNASSSNASSQQSSPPASASAVAFSLEVATPPSGVRLAPADAAAVADLAARCCPPPAADPAAPDYDAGAGALCRLALPAALRPNHPADVDLCALPPITCDDEGKLRQLTLAGAGLDCGGKGLPPSFANLTSLRLLDVAFNDVGGTVADLAAIASTLPQLRALFARYAGLAGRLEDACPLVAGGALEVLSLSGNGDIAGTVPSCLLAAPQLEELYISGLAVSGPLPDVVPQSSRLRALYAIGSLQGPSADDANNTSSSSSSSSSSIGGALTGTIPPSIVNAKSLMRLDLSGQQLEGGVPPLPDSLVYLNVSGNGGLASLPPSLPPRLAVLDLHGNAFKGAPPSITLSLVLYDISDNLFEGGMPVFVGNSIQMGGGGSSTSNSGSGRRSLLKSAAQRRGLTQAPEPPSLLAPSLRTAVLARNALAGPLPDAWAAAPAYLRVFDAGSNKLAGPLPRDWRLRNLEVLDLSNNTITGSLPTSLASLPSLVYLDASNNALSGGLGPYADALAQAASNLLVANLSANAFRGELPDASLARSPMLSNASDVSLFGATRLLDLSANPGITGPFPLALVAAIPAASRACRCLVAVALPAGGGGIGGGGEGGTAKVGAGEHALACPAREELAAAAARLDAADRARLAFYGFTCALPQPPPSAPSSSPPLVPLVRLLDAAGTGGDGSSGGQTPQSPGPDANKVGSDGGSKGSNPNAGAIAGIVIASVATAGLLAAGVFAWARRHWRRRAGWQKEALDGAPSGGAVDGGGAPTMPWASGQGPPVVGGGWGARPLGPAPAGPAAAARPGAVELTSTLHGHAL